MHTRWFWSEELFEFAFVRASPSHVSLQVWTRKAQCGNYVRSLHQWHPHAETSKTNKTLATHGVSFLMTMTVSTVYDENFHI